MTVADLAAFTGLTWDTVKNIIKRRLEKDYGRPRLRDLKRLSIDEIYLGKRQGFWTQDVSSGLPRGVEATRCANSGQFCGPAGHESKPSRWT